MTTNIQNPIGDIQGGGLAQTSGIGTNAVCTALKAHGIPESLCEAAAEFGTAKFTEWANKHAAEHSADHYWGDKSCVDLPCPANVGDDCSNMMETEDSCRKGFASMGANSTNKLDEYDVASINNRCSELNCNTCSNKTQYSCTPPEVNTNETCTAPCAFKVGQCCKKPSDLNNAWQKIEQTVEDNWKFTPFPTILDWILIGIGLFSLAVLYYDVREGRRGQGAIFVLFIAGLILGLGLGGVIKPYQPKK